MNISDCYVENKVLLHKIGRENSEQNLKTLTINISTKNTEYEENGYQEQYYIPLIPC